MKRTLLVGVTITALFAEGTFAAEFKVGVANLQKCFEEYYKTKQADVTLKEAAEAYNKERQQLISDFQKVQEERNKLVEEMNKPELSEAAKKEKSKEAETKLADLRKQKDSIDEFDRVRRQALQDQSNRMRSSIVKEITDRVVQIAKAQNFTLILDSSGASMNGTAVLVYFEDRLDVTLDVIREMNRNAPPPEPAKPSGAKPAGGKTNEPAKEAVPTPK